MTRLAAALAVFSLMPAAALAQATQPPAPPPPPAPMPYYGTAHRHLGFALRLDAGPGYTSTSASAIDATMKGGSFNFGLVVGGAVSEDFILGGDIWGTTVFSPTFTQAGTSFSGTNASFSLTGFGLNLTYYFMPANVYVSVSPSLTTVSLTEGGMSGSTDTGFGMKLAVGKEWWVGDHWGIGVAGQFFFASNKDKGTNPPTWSTTAGGVAFSATYN